MNVKKIKEKALKNLKGNYSPLVTVLLIFFIVSVVCSITGKMINNMMVASVINLIADSLLVMGFVKMIVKVSNKKKADINDLLSETNSFLKYIGVMVMISLIIFILALFGSIAFKSLVNVMTYFSEINIALGTFLVIFGLLLTTIIVMIIVYISITFSQVLFIMHDEPKLSVTEVLSKSFDMMDGYVIDYFILTISFIGWIILGIFTFGLLYLWLIPYMMTSWAIFYKSVRKHYDSTTGNKKVEKIFNDKDSEKAE